MSVLAIVLGLVLAQRGGELVLAHLNTRRLLAQGAYEVDPAGYKWLVLLHAGWLASLALTVVPATLPSWPLLGLYAAAQPVRLWIIASLGQRWTTRIIVLGGAPLVSSGPYRYFRHPNYAVVAVEIATLPLAFGGLGVALLFSLLNLGATVRRIRLEDRALRRYGSP